MWLSTMASPGPRLAPPHERARRLKASVKFLVKTSSDGEGAPMNRAVRARADSIIVVARSAIS